MKKSHIAIIGIIAVAIGIIITTAGDASQYVAFNDALKMAEEGNNRPVHVVGELKKDSTGTVVGITPGEDKVSFSFVMVDEAKKEQQVMYNQPMPTDFTKSEKVVVVGRYVGNDFVANQILLKCPSKYQEKNKLNAGLNP